MLLVDKVRFVSINFMVFTLTPFLMGIAVFRRGTILLGKGYCGARMTKFQIIVIKIVFRGGKEKLQGICKASVFFKRDMKKSRQVQQ